MKKLIPFIAFLALLTVSCRERTAPLRDTISYVKQLAEDSTAFSLVRAYRSQGTRGSIAVVGEPEAALLLSEAFLQADVRDNIDGKPGNDRLPDFAGESFDVIMDAYNAPYRRMAESSRLSKKKAKVFVLASSMLTEFGQFDIDTLVKMASREPLILNPVDAMMDAVRGASLAHVAAWVPAPAKPAYEAAATGLDCAVISPVGGSDVRSAFRDLLRQYRSLKPNTALDAVLVDSFTMDLEELHAEVEHIHRQITEEDMAFDRLLAPKFHFIEPKSSLTEACYRLLREKNLFTHDIAYPAVRYYQTEEGMDGDFVLVEIGSEYLANLRSGILDTPDKAPDYVYVPDND